MEIRFTNAKVDADLPRHNRSSAAMLSVMTCPHRPECPGCDLDELPYEAALERKTTAVRDALRRYPATAGIVVEACVGTAETRRYRTRVKWVVDESRIGLFGPAHRVVDTPNCQVAASDALNVADVLRTRGRERETRLTGVDIRTTEQGETAAVLIVEAERAEDARHHAERLAADLREHLPDVSVASAWRRPGTPTVLGDPPSPIAGRSTLRDRIGLVASRFPPGAFSQVHRGQTGVLHGWLRDAVRQYPTSRVVDLYAGTGGLGLAVADLCAELVLVEPFAPAVEAARAEAGPQVRVIGTHAERALAELPAPTHSDVFIIDPPRTGLTGDAVAAVVRARPAAILMVSCEPETLARDLSALAAHGFSTQTVRPIDMMPGTSQVESFTVLVAGRPPDLRRIVASGSVQSMGRLVVDKPPFFPTIPHPEWPHCALDDARRVDLELQPAHRIDAGTSGVLLFARGGSAVLVGATKSYELLVRGIVRSHGTIRLPLDERGELLDAETRYERLRVVGTHSLVRATLVTGRTHQIRRHFAELDHPVLGDSRYGDARSNQFMFSKYGLNRTFLHAARLELADGEVFSSPLPPDLAQVLDKLNRDGGPSGGRAHLVRKRPPR